jgi:hypothetical protein
MIFMQLHKLLKSYDIVVSVLITFTFGLWMQLLFWISSSVKCIVRVGLNADLFVTVPLWYWILIGLTLILLMWRKGWAPNSIPIYIQQDAKLHSLFISGNYSTCFGWYFHPSSGAHTTTSTASGICHTVTAICRYRERVGTGLSVLWVAYATHSTQELFLKPCLASSSDFLYR